MRPDVFAAVMATGIVSIAAADHGLSAISEVLIVVAAVTLPVLMVLVARAWREFDMRDPSVTLALFTYIAACAVVGARLADHRIVLWVLAGMALQGWLSLMPLRHRPRPSLACEPKRATYGDVDPKAEDLDRLYSVVADSGRRTA